MFIFRVAAASKVDDIESNVISFGNDILEKRDNYNLVGMHIL